MDQAHAWFTFLSTVKCVFNFLSEILEPFFNFLSEILEPFFNAIPPIPLYCSHFRFTAK